MNASEDAKLARIITIINKCLNNEVIFQDDFNECYNSLHYFYYQDCNKLINVYDKMLYLNEKLTPHNFIRLRNIFDGIERFTNYQFSYEHYKPYDF